MALASFRMNVNYADEVHNRHFDLQNSPYNN